MSLQSMQVASENGLFDKNFALQRKKISNALKNAIADSSKKESLRFNHPSGDESENLVIFSMGDNRYVVSMDELFYGSEQFVLKDDLISLQQHRL